ncbi:hypothetical protein ACOME3_005177 [Neoechinorhynchus agilis]
MSNRLPEVVFDPETGTFHIPSYQLPDGTWTQELVGQPEIINESSEKSTKGNDSDGVRISSANTIIRSETERELGLYSDRNRDIERNKNCLIDGSNEVQDTKKHENDSPVTMAVDVCVECNDGSDESEYCSDCERNKKSNPQIDNAPDTQTSNDNNNMVHRLKSNQIGEEIPANQKTNVSHEFVGHRPPPAHCRDLQNQQRRDAKNETERSDTPRSRTVHRPNSNRNQFFADRLGERGESLGPRFQNQRPLDQVHSRNQHSNYRQNDNNGHQQNIRLNYNPRDNGERRSRWQDSTTRQQHYNQRQFPMNRQHSNRDDRMYERDYRARNYQEGRQEVYCNRKTEPSRNECDEKSNSQIDNAVDTQNLNDDKNADHQSKSNQIEQKIPANQKTNVSQQSAEYRPPSVHCQDSQGQQRTDVKNETERLDTPRSRTVHRPSSNRNQFSADRFGERSESSRPRFQNQRQLDQVHPRNQYSNHRQNDNNRHQHDGRLNFNSRDNGERRSRWQDSTTRQQHYNMRQFPMNRQHSNRNDRMYERDYRARNYQEDRQDVYYNRNTEQSRNRSKNFSKPRSFYSRR